MKETILNHRTIRKYKDDPIEKSLLSAILTAASRASTTGNMQVYSIIVTTNKAIKEKLWEAHFRQNMVLQAPVILTFCADFNRFNKWCRQRKAEPGYDNFLSFFTAAIDALLAAQNAALAAEEQGLGICYLGTTTYNADMIIDILDLPSDVIPVTTLVVGYPDESPGLTDRLPMEGIVHQEKYRDYEPADIDRIYAEKDNSELTQKLLQENNLETLAQIFTQKRYTKKDNEFFSQKLLEGIRKQGFGM
ncbi:MAG: nitroreductase family protein [Bacteroidales bacterium]|nr:nitroreductase family protein [Bacteroidales bacterium]